MRPHPREKEEGKCCSNETLLGGEKLPGKQRKKRKRWEEIEGVPFVSRILNEKRRFARNGMHPGTSPKNGKDE